MFEAIPADWRSALREVLSRPSMASLEAAIARERELFDVYPPASEVFTALRLTPLASVGVVILGQDPYHQPGEAHGLALSVRPGVPLPPTLRTILDVLDVDLGRAMPRDGSLVPWAERGMLLLNAALTVRRNTPGSHARLGWGPFTRAVLEAVAAKSEPVVFMLWGARAQRQVRELDLSRHVVIATTHPSPRSAWRRAARLPAFATSGPFRTANEAFAKLGQAPIRWDLGPE